MASEFLVVADPVTRLTATSVDRWLVIVVFAALPSVGLVEGPSYAGLIFGLAVVQLIGGALLLRRIPVVDPGLGVLAAAFASWCWVSVAWSLDPAGSTAAALQMTAILAASLVFLSGPRLTGKAADRLFHVLFGATLAGGLIFVTDRELGYPLQSLFMGHSHSLIGTKYNRGLDHLVLIVWPQLAFLLLRGDWRDGLILGAFVMAIEGIGLSLAGELGILAGATVLGVAYWRPRLAGPLLAAVVILFVASQPIALRMLAEHRAPLAPYLKLSGMHRLEIWDFMTARALDHPLLGWGFGVANRVPITPEELSHFVIQHDQGIYPHDQWLGLWVETGAPGAAIGLSFALLVLWRIGRLADPVRPFAYATFASAMAISSVNFEVKTDSWWAALVASAYLLTTLHPPAQPIRAKPHAVLPAERA